MCLDSFVALMCELLNGIYDDGVGVSVSAKHAGIRVIYGNGSAYEAEFFLSYTWYGNGILAITTRLKGMLLDQT